MMMIIIINIIIGVKVDKEQLRACSKLSIKSYESKVSIMESTREN